ncbi:MULTISPECIES: hypothetical protein [unclassified Streptomyces]|nr:MULTISPECIES: hypothetical protein [unclassified Streptomyces]MEE1760461.1 hypothetical protein [Streptomyces sp. SP18BB07]MEE1833157.1 hypothetical protein [Streptomyces sp. SP17KL33]
MATTSGVVELPVLHHAEVYASPRRCPADRSRQVYANKIAVSYS